MVLIIITAIKDVQKISYHVHDHLGVCLSLGVGEVNLEIGHGPQDGHQGLDRVRVHDGPVLLEVLASEAALVDNFHLFNDCAFPGFSST